MNRAKAALIHLAISSFALLILTLLTVLVWYTYPHFLYEGVLHILALITLVDVVLGPMLTFIVVRPDKAWSEIRFDLSVIAIVQVAAFGYGAWAIQSQHPEFVLYAEGRFTTIPASRINLNDLQHDSLNQSFHIGPMLAAALTPQEPAQLVELEVAFLTEGKTIEDFAQHYRPYPPPMEEIAAYAIDIDLLSRDAAKREQIETFLEGEGIRADDIYLLPLVSYTRKSVIALRREDVLPVGFLDLYP